MITSPDESDSDPFLEFKAELHWLHSRLADRGHKLFAVQSSG
jgi:hypothetical protein